MIYTIEKRNEFGDGGMVTHYEVRSYDHRSEHTGALIGGKTIKSVKTKREAVTWCGNHGVKAET